jgi:hypothetical protein
MLVKSDQTLLPSRVKKNHFWLPKKVETQGHYLHRLDAVVPHSVGTEADPMRLGQTNVYESSSARPRCFF